MFDYWGGNPPTHRMVAAYFGIKSKNEPKGDLGELVGMFNHGAIM